MPEPRPLPIQHGITGRVTWAMAAQIASSASNFAVTVFVLASASVRDFAVFSLCFTTYQLAAHLGRYLAGTPILVLHSDGKPQSPAQEQAAVSTAVVLGCGGSAMLLAVGLATGSAGPQFLVLGMLLPLLLFQDAGRHLGLAKGMPQVTAASDLTWLILQLVASAAVFAAGADSALVLLAIWAASGAIAGIVLARRLKIRPYFTGARGWLREHRVLCRRLLVEFAMTTSSYYVLLYALPLVAGLSELGRLRAAQTLIGPVIVLLLGGNALGVPESVRARGDTSRLRRVALGLGGALAIFCLAWGTATFLLLPRFGPVLFPASWESARPLLPVLTLYATAVGVAMAATGGLRALGASRWISRARTVGGALTIGAGIPAAALFGAGGTLAALALSEWLVAGAACFALWRLSARPHRAPEDPLPVSRP